MKTSNRLFLLALTVLAVSVTAAAQLRFGVRGGLGINDMKFDQNVLDNKNYLGYSVGVAAEFQVPVIGIAVEGAALYTHRTSELRGEGDQGIDYKRNYIEVPVHAKYKLTLPVVDRIVVPFIHLGPNFAFLTNSDDEGHAFKDKKMAVSLDVGGGVEIVRKLQLAVNYGLGMSKAFEYVGVDQEQTSNIKGKDRCWTIMATYFF